MGVGAEGVGAAGTGRGEAEEADGLVVEGTGREGEHVVLKGSVEVYCGGGLLSPQED